MISPKLIIWAMKHFHLKLLTVHVMWLENTVYFQAQEQLILASMVYGMDHGEC
jgi:hypothetical protein